MEYDNMIQAINCDACGQCCTPYVTVSVSDIIRVLNSLNEGTENWQKYFNLLIDEKGYWYHSCILELKEGDSGNCIFFDFKTQLCSIHSFKPWKCSRYYCRKFREETAIEEFYQKHGLEHMLEEDNIREKQFNIETSILINAVSLYNKNISIEKVKKYLKDLKSDIGLQKHQVDMFIRIIINYSKKKWKK
jgi:Fe-S-cluster containining protein